MTRVLLISATPIAERMAASGIRYLEMARVISSHHDVSVAAPIGSDPAVLPRLHIYDPRRPVTLDRPVLEAEVVISMPLSPRLMRGATLGGRRWIVDLLNPEPFEGLEHHKHREPRLRRAFETLRIDRVTYAMLKGCAFICGNERQRDMWLGFLAACRRLDRADYLTDTELRGLIEIVPPGIPSTPPRAPARPVLRGKLVAADARVLLWNGGVWPWLDAATVVHSFATLRASDARWALVFQGGVLSPRGTHVSHGSASRELLELIASYGFEAGAVHVHDEWTPYDRRGDMLLEADVGVCAHHPSLEARFSFRNRVLDFVWARLPAVVTAGDALAEEAARGGWAEVVAPCDTAEFVLAAARVAEAGKDAYLPALDAMARRYDWQRVARPLLTLIESEPARRGLTHEVIAGGLAKRHGAASRLSDLIGRP